MAPIKKWIPEIVLFLILFSVQNVWAWGPPAHRIVGEIADSHLLPSVKIKIEKNFSIKKLSDVANWADTIKKKRSQGSWHYCNIKELNRSYDRDRDCSHGACVVEKISEFVHILQGRGHSKKEGREALMYLVHFVGDIHQPLHLGNARDRGGNNISLSFKGRRTNLHALWDGGLIYLAGKSLVQYASDLSRRVTDREADDWNQSHVTEWANESRVWALDHAYVLERADSGTLSKRYIEKSREIIDLRLTQAGVRLAGLLNRLLK
ncbi:MAG: S1/P1 nuclease [Nitrospinae bacterium]|nr:S1/P1 nuclease [Nitrospinota bacterium]MDA1110504.1 S1/P1 nuclease [Nitrospinota bacterium]